MATPRNNLMGDEPAPRMSTSVGIVYTAVAGIAWVSMGIASLFGYRPEPVREPISEPISDPLTQESVNQPAPVIANQRQ